MEWASRGQRLLAYIIDFILLNFINGLISSLNGLEQTRYEWNILWGIVGVTVPLAYYILAYSTSGQTVGKHILKIKVVSIDGSPLNWRKGLLRTVGFYLFGVMGLVWPFRDKNNRAWHDKLSGTCVVPASLIAEQLQNLELRAELQRNQRRWLVGLGIPIILLMAGILLLLLKGVSEVNDMGMWPDSEVSPAAIITLDLSYLGLKAGQPQNAHDDPMWADGGYKEGVLITYELGTTPIVGIWALKYQTLQAAANDYNSVRASADDVCRLTTSANFGNNGVVHCQFDGGYQKLFWNGYWIVNIVALETHKFKADVLVDQVRDAISAHWRTAAWN